MRYCVYDYPNTRVIPDYRMWVTISAENYAKLDYTYADSGVGVYFVPSPPSHHHWLQQRQHVRSHGFMYKFMSPRESL